MASYFTAISVANEAASSVTITTLVYLPSSPSELLNNYVTLFSTDTDDVTRTKTSYMSSLHKNNDLKAVTCRFGTIFGVSPGMRFHTAVNKFCWQASMGIPITVWKTAYDQKRPYLDLYDASKAIMFIIQNDVFDGRIYNILTSNSTVREITDMIKEFVPSLEIEFVDNRIMNQLSYEVLCDRFKSKGFIFTGNLKRGVKETIDLLKNSNNK